MNEKIRIIPYESTFQDEVVDLIVHIQQKRVQCPHYERRAAGPA